jgi:hypothetical protein
MHHPKQSQPANLGNSAPETPISLMAAAGVAPERPVKRSVTLAPELVERLAEYADFFGASPHAITHRYLSFPLHYSLDGVIAIASNPADAATRLAGVPARFSSVGQTAGFVYFHGGLILAADARQGEPLKRTTVHGIDPKTMLALSPEAFPVLLKHFEQIVGASNHDPLHTLEGRASRFTDYDRHFRYGGVEFAPTVLHAAFMQKKFSSADGAFFEEFADSCLRYLEVVGTCNHERISVEEARRAKTYFVSVALRHLLLVFPESDTFISDFLSHAQETVFRGESVAVNADRLRKVVHRDFSLGAHPDEYPADYVGHVNRVEPYKHGENSMIRPWLTEFVERNLASTTETSIRLAKSRAILLDTLTRGHGAYSIVSAAAANPDVLNLGRLRRLFCA